MEKVILDSTIDCFLLISWKFRLRRRNTDSVFYLASAVGLVTAVLRFAPALKNASNSLGSGNAASNAAGAPLQHVNSGGSNVVGKDPERERRAYETVNCMHSRAIAIT